MNPLQPKPGHLGQIYAVTWDAEGKVWFLAPYTIEELTRRLSQ